MGSLFKKRTIQNFQIASQSKSVENERSSGVSKETPLDMACSLFRQVIIVNNNQ
jgi:hypothetical protein